ncbi:hypothetical protein EAS61_29120 [Bradyrhizobium zhanjiangense]|uniref:Rap1a immunity protein domain-containing protein n=1 Tax=Bradyrhizobium zhanjiangense TaxID=1325107 RepID=A0A4V1KVE4_9BRAD|nr:hypothetical protein EAS61_29120 [Bradyrhizobium zhanjiangense]
MNGMRFLNSPKIVAVALMILPFSAPAIAETSGVQWLKQYRESSAETRQLIESITAAEQDGMAWHAARTKIDAYCPPRNLSLTGSQLLDILGRSIVSSPALGEQPWGLALLFSLERTFPCPSGGASR